MKELFLIRHGQAAAGESRMDRDFSLTELGRKQAHLLGRRLKAMEVAPERIYTSDLTRARQTAEILAEHVPAPVHCRRDLIEHGSEVFLHDGSLEEAARRYPERVLPDGTPRTVQGDAPGLHWEFSVGGEDLRALHKRARGAWEDLKRLHPGETGQYLLVAHGSFLSAMLTEAFELPLRPIWNFSFGNAGCAHIRFHMEAGSVWPALCAEGPEGEAWIQDWGRYRLHSGRGR